MNKLTRLYRPVGSKELELIEQSEMTAYPPRLEWQPIFYPVLNETYACEIAERWNTEDEGSRYAGFMTTFEIDTAYFKEYEIQNVGSAHHNELWVPAERLDEFNQNIKGEIEVTRAFYGNNFLGIRKY